MKYEETLGSRRPPRKPGYRSPPQQAAAEESWRHAFSRQLIAALEDAASVETRPRSAEQLARAAYDKLQFDFPLVSETELEALVASLQTALDGGRWPPLPLTAALLHNALEGSHPSPQPAGPVAEMAQPAAECTSASGGAADSKAGSNVTSPTAGSPHVPQRQAPAAAPDVPRLQRLCQQLAACLVVKLARRAVEAPPADAFAQLASFQPDAIPAATDAVGTALAPQQSRPSDSAAAAPAAAAAALTADGGGPAADAAGEQPGTGTAVAEPRMAAEEDGDDCTYEDLQPLPPPRRLHTPGQPGSYSWEALQAKLAAIAAHAQYSNFAGADAWQPLRLAEDVVALLAAARRHEHCSSLVEMSSTYVDLLAERVADAPAAAAAFEQLCSALGAAEAAKPVARGVPPPMPHGLHAAAAFGARAFATLLPQEASQGPAAAGSTASSRAAAEARAAAARTLARGVHAALLPPLGAWLGAVAAAKGGLAATKGGTAASGPATAEGPAVPSPACASEAAGSPSAAVSQPGPEEGVRLACRVVAAAVLGARAAGGSSRALLDSGVFRALVVLFAARRIPDMPELGVTLLLAACSDAALSAWAAAVPAFVPALLQPCFQAGGRAAAEGAVWARLLPAAKRPRTLPALEQLLALDAAAADATEQLAPLRATLALLADCRTAGGGRRAWGAEADARLRALPAQLNTLDMRLSAAGSAGDAGGPAAAAAAPAAAPATPAAASLAQLPNRAPANDAAPPGAAAAMPDEPAGHRGNRIKGAAQAQRQRAAAAAQRRACRECAALAKDLAAGRQASAKRD